MKRLNVLVACERSGVVRDAFIARGHDAVSCDLYETDAPGPHIVGDARLVNMDGVDLLIAHPPCTDIAVSGAAHFKKKIADGRQQEALDFVRFFLDAPVPRIAVENPISVISSQIYPPTQIIQPYQFGHPTTKATCLWLEGLWPLMPTNIVEPEYGYSKTGKKYDKWWLWTSSLPHPLRAKERSQTFQGIADAMAEQWGGPIVS